MTNLNPSGSGARMLATKTNEIDFCLVAVDKAILGGKPSLVGHVTANAAQAWADAGPHQHETHAPADFPTFFSGAGGKGDVVIAVGDGVNCVASDYTTGGVTHWGHIGVMTLADRARQVGGKLLGWTDLFLGYTLVGTDPTGGGVTPVPFPTPVQTHSQEEEIMLIRNTARGDFLCAPGIVIPQGNTAILNILATGGQTIIPVVDGDIDAILTSILGLAGVFPSSAGTYPASITVNPVLAGSGSSGGVTAAQVQTISDASDKSIQSWITALANLLNTDVTTVLTALAKVPTAAQNGAAARTAIVAAP